jgi:hypothetical protein
MRNSGGADATLSQRRKFRRQVVKVDVDPGEVDALIDRL